MGCAVLRYLFVLTAFAAVNLLASSSALAQAILDPLAAQGIRSELEGGSTRRAANAAQSANVNKDNSDEADPSDNGEPSEEEADAADGEGAKGKLPDSSSYTDSSGLVRSRSQGQEDRWGDQHAMYRDARPFVSLLKLLGVVLVFLFWIGACAWVNRASQNFKLGYARWNAIIAFCGFAGLVVVMVVPVFLASFLIYLCLVFGPFIAFSVVHNRAVEQHQKVFTREWVRYEFAQVAGKLGMKVDAEMKADYEKGPPVDLFALGGADERANQANLMTARQSPGYILVKELISEMSLRRSERVLLDYAQDAVGVRHYIDGVWDAADPRDRESGDVMLAVMKQLSDLDVKERKKKQTGEFAAKFNGSEYRCPVVSQGVKTGERVMLSLVSPKLKALKTYKDLGMRDKLAEEWSQSLLLPEGVLVISSMPEGGLTTLTDVSLMETDRLMRDVFSIEDKNDPEREIENIVPHFYDQGAGESPATLMPKLIRKYPDVYVCRDFVNAESAKALIDEAKEDRLVITSTRAKEASESLLRVLQKKAPHKDFAQTVQAAINVRLIRLLCSECKVGYEPAAELLKKLAIPAGKVQQLYRPPTSEEASKPCKKCGGSGYFGRTGVFELLEVDDTVRETLLKQPKMDAVRKAARAAGMRTLQEEGVLLVAKGVTSLQELQRVMKQ